MRLKSFMNGLAIIGMIAFMITLFVLFAFYRVSLWDECKNHGFSNYYCYSTLFK